MSKPTYTVAELGGLIEEADRETIKRLDALVLEERRCYALSELWLLQAAMKWKMHSLIHTKK